MAVMVVGSDAPARRVAAAERTRSDVDRTRSETAASARRSRMLEFRVLGPVEVLGDGIPIPLDGSKQRTMLAALLLARGRMISDSQLSCLLWGDNPPNTASAQIYTYVSRLRKYLGPGVEIQRRRPGYTMSLGAMKADFLQFEHHSRAGREALRAGRYETAAGQLRAGLGFWRGPALANVTEFLADVELYRLEEARMAALESRIEADLALGRHAALVPELTGLVGEYPLRESLRAQLMVALYRVDRQSDALAVYHDVRRILAEEMGSDPGVLLSKVYKSILDGDPQLWRPEGIREAGPAEVHHERPPAMLPPDVAHFTGHGPELDRVLGILTPAAPGRAGGRRFPVVTGMAGSGKTALALRATHALHAQFPDGQLYADLGGTTLRPTDPSEALAWFLRALKVPDAAIPGGLYERTQLFRSMVAGQRVLLLLDNAASDDQVRPLLPGGPDCRVIVTSRCRLAGLDGAELIDLHPLSAEESLDLVAKVIGPERLGVEPAAARRVVDLCGRLPLGLRIVAARLAARPHWPVSRLASCLENEQNRLGELRFGAMDVQESLRASYRRIGQQARTALRRLARLTVPEFPAWTVAAVLRAPRTVGEEIAEALVDARLLDPVRPDRTGRLRYRFHDLVRLFALAQPLE